MTTATTFDLEEFARAFAEWDVDALVGLYSDDVEHVELDDKTPPGAPGVRRGTQDLERMLRHCRDQGVKASVDNLVPGTERAACTVTCVMPSGRRVVANTILELRDGLIARELQVLARDP